MQRAGVLTGKIRGLAGTAGALVLAWMAAHAVLLALLALAWGLLLAGKVVLGWLAHAFALVFLLAAGVLLALWLWQPPRPLRLTRPA